MQPYLGEYGCFFIRKEIKDICYGSYYIGTQGKAEAPMGDVIFERMRALAGDR